MQSLSTYVNPVFTYLFSLLLFQTNIYMSVRWQQHLMLPFSRENVRHEHEDLKGEVDLKQWTFKI